MRSERVRILAEIALTIALCAVLNLWRLQLPWNVAGGNVSFAMLPLMVLALRRGVLPAAVAGAAFGVVDFVYEPFAVAPIQVLLDYPVAFAVVSLTGLGSRQYRALSGAGKGFLAEAVVVPWMTVGAAARFLAHFVSGIVFFGSAAPAGQPVWVYSALYNLGYMVPSLVLSIAAGLMVMPVLNSAVPMALPGAGEKTS